MKPRPFRYEAPESLEEACQFLSEYGDDAKVIAGGQSLGPLMNLRLASPEVLVDVNRLPSADRLEFTQGESLVAGLLVRQRDAERSDVVTGRFPLIADALRWVGHIGIRNRGTVVGSLAHGDPAAELPSVATALGATVTAVSCRGTRVLPVADLYETVLTTVLEPEEILTQVIFPSPPPRTGHAWAEFAIRHGDFALVGVAASVTLDQVGRCTEAMLVYAGVDTTPHVASAAASMLLGEPVSDEVIAAAAARAAADADPSSDIFGDADYRRRLMRVLTTRALAEAYERTGDYCE